MTGNICDLADANLVESIREHARWQSPCEMVEEDGVLLVAGVTAFPGAYRNCVARVDQAVPAHEVVARAKDFFSAGTGDSRCLSGAAAMRIWNALRQKKALSIGQIRRAC